MLPLNLLLGFVLVLTRVSALIGTARLVLDAAQFGGQAASAAMGLGFGSMSNPNSGAESSTIW